MLTLRELLLELDKTSQFRVYMPNRDCLGFESFYLPHSAPGVLKSHKFFDEKTWDGFKKRQYCKRAFRSSYDDLDEETKELIDQYGDKKVHSLESSDYINFDTGESDNCLDIFILA